MADDTLVIDQSDEQGKAEAMTNPRIVTTVLPDLRTKEQSGFMPPLTLFVLVKDLLEDADADLGPRLLAVAGNVVALAARPLTGLLVNPEPMSQ